MMDVKFSCADKSRSPGDCCRSAFTCALPGSDPDLRFYLFVFRLDSICQTRASLLWVSGKYAMPLCTPEWRKCSLRRLPACWSRPP